MHELPAARGLTFVCVAPPPPFTMLLQVRDVGSVFLGPEFESLQELHLDSNMLVDISGG